MGRGRVLPWYKGKGKRDGLNRYYFMLLSQRYYQSSISPLKIHLKPKIMPFFGMLSLLFISLFQFRLYWFKGHTGHIFFSFRDLGIQNDIFFNINIICLLNWGDRALDHLIISLNNGVNQSFLIIDHIC